MTTPPPSAPHPEGEPATLLPTPLTDAVTFDLQIHGDAYHERIKYPDGMGDFVEADHARSLERDLATLKADNLHTTAERDHARAQWDAVAKERDTLKARVEELEGDKERLDWLEQFFSFENVDYSESEQRSWYAWTLNDDRLLEALGGRAGWAESDPTLRAAIDKARAELDTTAKPPHTASP